MEIPIGRLQTLFALNQDFCVDKEAKSVMDTNRHIYCVQLNSSNCVLRVHNTVNPTTCILHNCLMKNSHSQIYFIFDKNIQRICIEPDHFHHIPNIFSLEDIMFHIAQRKRERARDTEMSICKRISFIFGLAFHFVLCHISAFCGI